MRELQGTSPFYEKIFGYDQLKANSRYRKFLRDVLHRHIGVRDNPRRLALLRPDLCARCYRRCFSRTGRPCKYNSQYAIELGSPESLAVCRHQACRLAGHRCNDALL